MRIHKTSIAALITSAVLIFSSVPVSASSGGVVDAGAAPSSKVPITIDGNYDDWADKTVSKLYYGTDPGENYISGTLFCDEEFVYLHIRMNAGNANFIGSSYEFAADSHKLKIRALIKNNAAVVEGINELELRKDPNDKLVEVPVPAGDPPAASGFMTHVTGQPDEWEIRIALSEFSGKEEKYRDLTFSSPNFGPQILRITATPTLPYLIAAGGLVVATAGYGYSRRKRSKK